MGYFVNLFHQTIFNLKFFLLFRQLNPISKKFFLNASLIISILCFAQDKKIDVDITTKSNSSNVFMQPWVWVVVGALFIPILVALLRNKNN